MKTKFYITFFICFIVIVFVIFTYLNKEQTIQLYEELTITKETECHGLFWHIIFSQDNADRNNIEYRIELPENDYSKNFLLISDGRKILSLKYTLISKYHSKYKVPTGYATFDEVLNPHEMYVYRIPKIFVKQDGD